MVTGLPINLSFKWLNNYVKNLNLENTSAIRTPAPLWILKQDFNLDIKPHPSLRVA
jgi:hypothetical protein